jgi:hypothetical protein
VVGVFLPILFLLLGNRGLAEQTREEEETIKTIQSTISVLESRLQMSQHIEVSIVPVEARMLSVQRIHSVSGSSDLFLMNLDRTFLQSLTQEELTAALAHELGHVWIFSHHPFLQTEALANEIAMKAVSRDALKTLYGKLWLHLGATGDLADVLSSGKTDPPVGLPVIASAVHQD